MSLIDHVGLPVSDYTRSRAFYQAVLITLDCTLLMEITAQQTGSGNHAGFGRESKPAFWIGDGTAPLRGRLHVCFSAQNRAQVDLFHARALALGAQDNGGPGLCPHYHPHYYGAFVLDPDGHNIEAVCHAPE